ncbi:hypothetical protein R2277_002754 [Cronobacter sakazakii]|nr:hypothetical protein [Cronobacter sakazakii]ELQ6154308.1 hypothetical protein [Cronobacter sakazakii]ELQ6163269.1 hypothetical protein [Cronobacter sakazakii]
MNNDELIEAGHELAKCLDSNTPLLDIAKLLSKMATQLDVTTEALREKTKQCDAEHNDVLAWEKKMFKVCGEDGTKSVAEKFASLEASRAALAEENAALKSAIQTHSESVHFCEVCGKDDPCSTDDVCYVLKQTPSTDAFLREVRAQGVGELAQFAGEEYRRHKAVGDRAGQRKWKGFVLLCADFANQIRKGGAA